MDKKVEQHLKTLRKYIGWNPEDNSYDYKLEVYDKDNLIKAMDRMCRECWGVVIPDIENMPLFNILFVAYGHAKPSDLLTLGKDAREPARYLSVVDDVPTFIKHTEQMTKDFYMLKPGTQELDFNGMKLKELDEDSAHHSTISSILKANGMPGWNNILHVLEGIPEETNKAIEERDAITKVCNDLNAELARLKGTVGELQLKAEQAAVPMEVPAVGDLPEGRFTLKKVSELFPYVEDGDGNKAKFNNDWEIPYWEWDAPHPHVPNKDPHYIFRIKELTAVLFGILTNQRVYLQGHTGSGKTTLIEQVAASLNWPFIRINFDSEITRMDLIGRDTLTQEDGKTVSKFVDGILPRAMSSVAMVCFDEFDFVRPDVAYVMQAATEGNGLRITEDGDRFVAPHPMFRMFATGNTVGQGDEDGMYQGARPQSIALLDRFTIWVNVDYLNEKQRMELIQRHYPSMSGDDLKSVCKYVSEHLAAFREGKLTQPISPRGMLAIARATTMMGDPKEAVTITMINRANQGDKVTLKGIVNRVFK